MSIKEYEPINFYCHAPWERPLTTKQYQKIISSTPTTNKVEDPDKLYAYEIKNITKQYHYYLNHDKPITPQDQLFIDKIKDLYHVLNWNSEITKPNNSYLGLWDYVQELRDMMILFIVMKVKLPKNQIFISE